MRSSFRRGALLFGALDRCLPLPLPPPRGRLENRRVGEAATLDKTENRETGGDAHEQEKKTSVVFFG